MKRGRRGRVGEGGEEKRIESKNISELSRNLLRTGAGGWGRGRITEVSPAGLEGT